MASKIKFYKKSNSISAPTSADDGVYFVKPTSSTTFDIEVINSGVKRTLNAISLSHAAKNVTLSKISNWDAAYSWGDYKQYGLGKLNLSTITSDFSELTGKETQIFSSTNTTVTGGPTGIAYPSGIHINRSTNVESQLVFGGHGTSTGMAFRNKTGATTWTDWQTVYHSGNISSLETALNLSTKYLPLSGGTLSGSLAATTFIGALNGNASTATTLATARTINGTSFDGSANITTANWGTARNITIGNTTKSVNGSGNVSWSLSEIGAASSTSLNNYVPYTGATQTVNLGNQRLQNVSSLDLTNNSMTYPNAINSNSDAWNQNSKNYFSISSGNNMLAIIGESTANKRTFGLQVGHNSSAYANASGVLELQPLHGDVRIGSLSGSGTRMVVANSLGTVSSQALPVIPTSSDYITTNTTQTGLSGNKITSGTWVYSSTSATPITLQRANNSGNSTISFLDQNSEGFNIGMATKDIFGIGSSADIANAANRWMGVDNTGTIFSKIHGNSSQWKQAFDWGDFRDYGLGITALTSTTTLTSTTIDNPNLPNGLYHIASAQNTGFSGSADVLVMRSGATGYTTQKMQVINAGDVVKMYLRHYKPSSSAWTPWREVITDENLDTQATSLGFIKSAALSGYVPTSRTITAGNGLSGGGSLAANRTITLGTPSAITLSSTNSVTESSHTHAFTPGGTTAQYIRGDGSLATFVDTTYSAGTGLSLSGTTFSQTITTSGSGTFVTGITQTANGFQINLGTPPNTTYSAGTLALLTAGTNTNNYLWSAKNISDFTDGKYALISPNQSTTVDLKLDTLGDYSKWVIPLFEYTGVATTSTNNWVNLTILCNRHNGTGGTHGAVRIVGGDNHGSAIPRVYIESIYGGNVIEPVTFTYNGKTYFGIRSANPAQNFSFIIKGDISNKTNSILNSLTVPIVYQQTSSNTVANTEINDSLLVYSSTSVNQIWGNTISKNNITASGLIKSDSSDSYVLLGGGGHRPVSDFALAGSLGDYLPLAGGTMTGVINLGPALTTVIHRDMTGFTTGGWARPLLKLTNGTNINELGHYGSGTDITYGYIGSAYNAKRAITWTTGASSQNVGIGLPGTEAPQYGLEVAGNIRFRNFTNGLLRVNASGVVDVDANTYALASALSGYVPYTGATANVNLGARSITSTGGFIGNASTATKLADIITTFTGTYPLTVNVSGTIYSHTGLTYTGSTGALTANSFVKSGGTSSQFLKADGSVDATAYTTDAKARAALVTSTSATGATNVATTNTNTYLNVTQNGASPGSSTQVTGAGSVTVASDANGKLTITGTNTTYTAGTGLTLSGTTFSLPVTTSGSGNVVSSVTQTANGISVSKDISAMTTSHAANGITSTNITNWNNSNLVNPSFNGATLESLQSGYNYGITQAANSDNPKGTSAWYNKLKILHSNTAGYYTEFAMPFTNTDDLGYRTKSNGVLSNWVKLLTSQNISSYSSLLLGRNRIHQSTAPRAGDITFVQTLMNSGFPLFDDPEFKLGVNLVNKYNLATVERINDDQLSANSSNKIIKISITKSGNNGFHQSYISRPNATFVQIFRAKLPVGYRFNLHENATGTTMDSGWLTDNQGTGKWEWYIRYNVCGETGTFSTAGHVGILLNGGTEPTTEVPLEFYLSYCNAFDLTQNQNVVLQSKTLFQSRKINGVDFDGSSDITTANWGTSRTLTIGNTGKSVNGSGNVAWSLSEIGAVNKSGDTMTGSLNIHSDSSALRFGNNADIGFIKQSGAPGKMIVGNSNPFVILKSSAATIPSVIPTSTTETFPTLLTLSTSGVLTTAGGFDGNASTATTLQTARTINGTSFNGSANITTALWGTSRNITIGNTTKSVNGSGNVAWSLSEIGAASQSSLGDYLPLTGGTMTGKITAAAFEGSIITPSGVEYLSTLKTSIEAAGWYRVFVSNTSNANGSSVILNVNRFYNNADNESYTFAINVVYNGGISITQLSGRANLRIISKIRVDYVNSGVLAVDIYYSSANRNDVYISGSGTGKFQAPALVASPTGTTVEFDTVNGVKSNLGFTGELTGNASSATNLSRSILAGNGLTGGGVLNADRTITLGTPSAITLTSTNSVATSSHTHEFKPGGTTAQYIRGDGSLATYVNTTYSAGNGLTLSGTAFSLPVTDSGSGDYVTNVVANANGLTVSKSTLPINSLVTSSSATGTSNVATTNTNTFLNIVRNGSSAGSSTQITGAGSVTVSSDASGKLTINGTNTNTTYSAGNGLTLSGTTFSLPVTQSGSGNVVSSVAQSANGITVTKDISAMTTSHIANSINQNLSKSSVPTFNSIELSANVPYIDFHFGNSTADYTSRIGEFTSGVFSFYANTKFVFNKNVEASGFINTSLRKYKTNIKPFFESGLDLINTLSIVKFDRKDTKEKNIVGVIADDTNAEFLSPAKNAVDLYKTIFIQAKAIQELNDKINKLETLVNKMLGN